jgi:segregation and condensation protein B
VTMHDGDQPGRATLWDDDSAPSPGLPHPVAEFEDEPGFDDEPEFDDEAELEDEQEFEDEPGDQADQPTRPALRPSLEAILLVADEPVPVGVLAQIVGENSDELGAELRAMADSYAAEQRGFDLREVGGGWRFYTRPEYAAVVEKFVSDGQEVRLTQAALETLAVVAYRQPVSRARVSAVRGVNCDGVMRTLVLRGLVEEAGNDPDTGAVLFQTTGYFLERLGLADLDDLPELAPFLPDHLEDELEGGHERAR